MLIHMHIPKLGIEFVNEHTFPYLTSQTLKIIKAEIFRLKVKDEC